MMLGQPIIIENVAGATGSVGVGRAVRAPTDGYTLIAGTLTTHVLIGALYTLPYDLLADFKPVALLADGPLLMTARQGMPVSDLKALIAWLKANPDKATQGITGVGAIEHVAAMLLQRQTGTRFQIVPYRGNAPAMQDLVAGQIDMMLADAATALPYVGGGRIKALAVMAKARMGAAPEIPTVDEAGLPEFYASLWYGLWAPAKTPDDIIAKLNAAAVAALADATVRKRARRPRPRTFRRSPSRRRRRSARARRPRSRNGGRSSRRRTSGRSEGVAVLAQSAKHLAAAKL